VAGHRMSFSAHFATILIELLLLLAVKKGNVRHHAAFSTFFNLVYCAVSAW